MPSIDDHPYVIASDPEKNPEKVVVVNLSGTPGKKDTGHTLDAGAHRVITKTSYVRCDRVGSTSVSALKGGVARNQVQLKSDVLKGGPLSAIHAALEASEMVPMELQGILKDQGLIK